LQQGKFMTAHFLDRCSDKKDCSGIIPDDFSSWRFGRDLITTLINYSTPLELITPWQLEKDVYSTLEISWLSRFAPFLPLFPK